jgi:hypothetical protein
LKPPKSAGLIADLDDLDAAQLREDPAATQPQQLATAQPGADLDEEVVAIEGPAGGQEVADLLGREGPSALVAKDLFGVQARLGGLHLPDRVGGEQAFLAGGLQDPQQDRATSHHPAMAELAGQSQTRQLWQGGVDTGGDHQPQLPWGTPQQNLDRPSGLRPAHGVEVVQDQHDRLGKPGQRAQQQPREVAIGGLQPRFQALEHTANGPPGLAQCGQHR